MRLAPDAEKDRNTRGQGMRAVAAELVERLFRGWNEQNGRRDVETCCGTAAEGLLHGAAAGVWGT